MGIEDEIRYLLHQGRTPQELVNSPHNYKKSTIYKVAETIKTFSKTISPPQWSIQNIRFNKPDSRYMPGEVVRVDFTFRNESRRDLYVLNIGVRAEWMIKENMWYSQPLKEIIRPMQAKFVSISFPIKRDISLGEYELLFGVEGQYLPVLENEGGITTTWSEPIILSVKHPLSGNKVFLSHSVQDKFLVRQLEQKLDEYGIETYLGEDISNPGSFLSEKFQRLIYSSNIFIAFLTRPALESPWVMWEKEYAEKLNKPMILLKDRSVVIDQPREWIEFSPHDPPEHIFQTIMSALEKLKSNSSNGLVAGAVGIGLLALLLAALSDR